MQTWVNRPQSVVPIRTNSGYGSELSRLDGICMIRAWLSKVNTAVVAIGGSAIQRYPKKDCLNCPTIFRLTKRLTSSRDSQISRNMVRHAETETRSVPAPS